MNIFQTLGRNLCPLNGSLVYRKFATYMRHHEKRYTDSALTHGPSVLAVDAVRALYHTVNLTVYPLLLQQHRLLHLNRLDTRNSHPHGLHALLVFNCSCVPPSHRLP